MICLAIVLITMWVLTNTTPQTRLLSHEEPFHSVLLCARHRAGTADTASVALITLAAYPKTISTDMASSSANMFARAVSTGIPTSQL
jgi:hypothetical protein